MNPTPTKPFVVPTKPSSNNLTFWLIALAIILLICNRLVASLGLNFYTWGDHLIGATGKSPVGIWVLGGTLAGIAVGAMVMSRKYQLQRSWSAIPVAVVVLLIILVSSLATPMPVIPSLQIAATPKPDSAISNTVNTPTKVHHRRQSKTVLTDTNTTAAKSTSETNSILTQQTEITVHARTDSVLLHYRTRTTHTSPWSAWQEKFLPSAGETSLTNDGLIKAHTIEWYYEVAGTATRSATSPFRKDHCDGAVMIDTY